MTPPRSPAGHAGPILVRADETDVDILSQVIAEAFFDLPPSRWLAPDTAARHAIFPGYFRLYVEHALACGLVDTTPDRDAVALWLPAGPGAPGPPDGYNTRLAATTGPLAARFEAFDAAMSGLDGYRASGLWTNVWSGGRSLGMWRRPHPCSLWRSSASGHGAM